MSLRHILLGMLREPASGYDLKKQFGMSLAHFYDAELSQIYPTLGRLETDGLLRSKREPSERGPERKVYSRTTAGARELESWLTAGPQQQGERLTWLAQVFFLGQQGDPELTLRFLNDLRDEFATELAALRRIEAGWSADDPRYPDDLPDDLFYPQLTLDLGLHKLAVKLEWADRCIARIEQRRQDRESA